MVSISRYFFHWRRRDAAPPLRRTRVSYARGGAYGVVDGIAIVGGHAHLAPPEAPQLVQEGRRVFEQETLQLFDNQKRTKRG